MDDNSSGINPVSGNAAKPLLPHKRTIRHARKPSFYNVGGAASSWVPFPPPEMASSFDIRPRLPVAKQWRQPGLYGSTVGSYEDSYDDESDEDEESSEDSSIQDQTEVSDDVSSATGEQQQKTIIKPAYRPRAEKTIKFRTSPEYMKQPVNWGERMTRWYNRMKRSMTKSMSRWNRLSTAPRELWIIYAMKFLSSYSYFSFTLVLVMFLSEEFDMDDTAAGWNYGMYGLFSTLFGVLCGWFIDYLGVKQSLVLGSLLGATARFVLAFTTSRFVALAVLYTALPFAECLGIPILTIGIKRYTNQSNRTFAFSFYYSIMNVAALVAGPLVDILRSACPDGMVFFGREFSALRVILISSALSTFLMLVAVWLGIREIEVDESGQVVEFEPVNESAWEQTGKTLKEPAFWRLTLFTVLLMGVRMVFKHVDATMPKYLIREFGPSAPFGLIYSINPFLIIFFVPIVGLMTREVDSFDMILFGSCISAFAPFWLVLGNLYSLVIMFMFTLSVGEAIYSPRVYEYTMDIAGRGSEGIYTSLASAPLFSVKLITGGMSGALLQKYCPAHGPRRSRMMWAIVGLTSLLAPILMWMLREVIHPTDNEDDDMSDEEIQYESKTVGGVQINSSKNLGQTSKPITIE